MSSRSLLVTGIFALACVVLVVPPVTAQSIVVEPTNPTLEVGETQQLTAYYVSPDGERRRDTSVVFFSRNGNAAPATRDGEVTGNQPGTHEVIALRPGTENQDCILQRVSVTVTQAAVADLVFDRTPAQVYEGTHGPLSVTAAATNGRERSDVTVQVESSDSSVATVDRLRRLHGKRPGTVTLTARAEGHEATTSVEVVENPVASLDLAGGANAARTGDVLDFEATPRDENGDAVDDAPVRYAVRTDHTEPIAPGATAEIGGDGRDYAITGTWGGNGEAYFWDVTDPSNITPVDTITVDARTVNDIKVSEDGRTCVISREGASDRKNGIVILDCADPTDVSIVTEYTNRLTGGVHNLFIYEDHVYALSNGRRYEIINIEDRANPKRVTDFELETPGHSIHDVWVDDGIAYSSNWDDGVVLVDVGNGVRGGSPSNPVEIGRYAYPSGWNHAAFPYDDEQTGKNWVIAGDEAFPNGLNTGNEPTIPAGWLHFVDFSDPDNPSEEARYRVPEAGSHNYWVWDDTLYVAYYNAGLRVVDLSGDLKGNLYEQGREIAHFKSFDPEGHVPNAPMAWGPQPYKGHVFFADWNLETGERAARLSNSRPVTHGVAVSPDSRHAFVTAEGIGGEPGAVDVFDLRSNERVASVDVGQQAGGIAFWKLQETTTSTR